MYYDTTAGAAMPTAAAVWGAPVACRPNVGVNLIPEYAGAVLNGSKSGRATMWAH